MKHKHRSRHYCARVERIRKWFSIKIELWKIFCSFAKKSNESPFTQCLPCVCQQNFVGGEENQSTRNCAKIDYSGYCSASIRSSFGFLIRIRYSTSCRSNIYSQQPISSAQFIWVRPTPTQPKINSQADHAWATIQMASQLMHSPNGILIWLFDQRMECLEKINLNRQLMWHQELHGRMRNSHCCCHLLIASKRNGIGVAKSFAINVYWQNIAQKSTHILT